MPLPSGFGISNPPAGKNMISRTRRGSAQTADLTDSEGKLINQVTHGAAVEQTEEFYVDHPENFTSEAVSGQHGQTVVTGNEVTEQAADWAKGNKTTRTLPDYAAPAG